MKELQSLNVYFKRYSGKMLLGIVCVILSNIAAIYVPVFVRTGLDEAGFHASFASATDTGALQRDAMSLALVFGVLVVLAAAVRGVFMYLMRQQIVVVSRLVEYDLKNDIYNHYQKLDTAFFRRNYTGDMMARIGEDVSNVRMYIGPAVMYIVNMLFTFITVIFQMASINPKLTFLALLPLPILSISIYRVSALINSRSTEIQNQLSVLTTFAQETFAGIRVIKSFGVENNFIRDFENEGKEYRTKTMKLALVNSLFFPLMLLLVGLSSLIVLYVGGLEVAKGRFTPGNIAEFVIYLNMLIWPVASLGWTTALIQKAAASQKRINEFLNTATDTNEEGTEPFDFKEKIEFKNVDFAYPNSSVLALNEINLTLPKGAIIGITGKTGSGKTTLAQLLMRLYTPQQGQITVDGKPLQTSNINEFRHAVAYVPQDVFLFSETIAENIAFGAESGTVSEQALQEVVRKAGLEKDIQSLPNGMQTMLGERGVTLSGGQKQRVSIARALLRNAELYVFDDCLSAVDAATEKFIVEEFTAELKDKTAVIISHRTTPLSVATHIVVLDQGRITEQGTFDELIAKNGVFAELHRKQVSETKEDTEK